MNIDTRTAAPSLPIETVTPIKPSEAIRLGCLIAPVQAFGDFRDGADSACVLGAMAYGWGWDDDKGYGDRLTHPIERALDVSKGLPDCSECGASDFGLGHLNDDHRWSRERIADWLEGLGL